MLHHFLPEKEFSFIHDLWLPNGQSHFQIDSFIVTPTYLLIIETKNMKGEITLNKDFQQMIQVTENGTKGYEDPLLQAQLQVRQLRQFLNKHHFPPIPIEYLVMMSHSNAILRTDNYPEAIFRVCRGRQVIQRIEHISSKFKTPLDHALVRKLCCLLLKKHQDPVYDIEEAYKIPRSDLLKGVHCPSCTHLGMLYLLGVWHCPKCGCKSRDAHLLALHDYYLLHGHTITNRQFREFLGIPSVNIANKMLRKLDLSSAGVNRHRIYQLSFDIKG
jgi:hypothetical protein